MVSDLCLLASMYQLVALNTQGEQKFIFIRLGYMTSKNSEPSATDPIKIVFYALFYSKSQYLLFSLLERTRTIE